MIRDIRRNNRAEMLVDRCKQEKEILSSSLNESNESIRGKEEGESV